MYVLYLQDEAARYSKWVSENQIKEINVTY